MSRSSGKALSLDTPIYPLIRDRTNRKGIEYRSPKTIGELQVGDIIYDADGLPTEVIHLNPIIFEDVYEVEFEDGEVIQCNGEHLWYVYDNNTQKNIKKEFKTLKIIETQYIYNNIFTKNNTTSHRFFVPLNKKKLKYSEGKKAIVNVRKLEEKKPMRCITVSNQSGLFLCGKHYTVTHNSYLTSPFIMARSLLMPNHNTYCMAPAGNQAQLTFKKLEDLAKGQIASVLGVSSFFLDECVRMNAKADPFTHSKQSYTVELFNGSTINTLNSVAKNIVGVRSNLSVFDEAGKIERDFYALTEPFSVQESSFVTGGNLNTDLFPNQLPNKNLYLSSAEGQDSHLFDVYKLCFNRMMMGDPNYFVCDLDCELSLHPFLNGKPTKPLVSQETIDNAFATNPYRARREYYNLWDNDSGPDAFVKRTTILKYSQTYWPIFENEGQKHYIVLYDPASKNDKSFVMVAEIFRDDLKGLMLKLVYAKNLVETLPNGQKAHIQKPEQTDIIKNIVLSFNLGFDDYDGIDILCIDAGAGGLKPKLPRKVICVIQRRLYYNYNRRLYYIYNNL